MSGLKYLSQKLGAAFGRFAGEKGAVAVEAVIILPALAFVYCSCFVWFDAVRNNTLAMKASYTISDILSREDEINNASLDGLNDLMQFLVPSNAEPKMRVTSIGYNDDAPEDNKYRLLWSYATHDLDDMTQAILDGAGTDWLPVMGDDETVVVTETFVLYQPIFNVQWSDPVVWKHVMITRPRFAGKLTNLDVPDQDTLDDIDSEGGDIL